MICLESTGLFRIRSHQWKFRRCILSEKKKIDTPEGVTIMAAAVSVRPSAAVAILEG